LLIYTDGTVECVALVCQCWRGTYRASQQDACSCNNILLDNKIIYGCLMMWLLLRLRVSGLPFASGASPVPLPPPPGTVCFPFKLVYYITPFLYLYKISIISLEQTFTNGFSTAPSVPEMMKFYLNSD
jgi:hypothetical protein